MPRGRPPIPRTKEQALTVRRQQTRKNVQAFRKRRKASKSPQECSLEVEGNAFTFVLEELGRNDVENPCRMSPSPTLCPNKARPKHQTLGAESKLGCSDLLPPCIDYGPASLQQLASNVAWSLFPVSTDQPLPVVHWSQVFPTLVNRNSTLDCAIQALCLLQIGHLTDAQRFIPPSLSYYDRALKSLKSTLEKPTVEFKLEILAAVMGLGAYECLQGMNAHGNGWLYHMKGAMSYLSMFPSMDVGVSGHQLFFHLLETLCAFDALGSRTPSPFSNCKWWKDSVDQYGGQDYGPLLRMLTSLPNLLEHCDDASASEPNSETHARSARLLATTWKMEAAFLHWFRGICNPCWSDQKIVQSPNLDIHCLSANGSTALFTSLFNARLHLLYWSAMTLLYESIAKLLCNCLVNSSIEEIVSMPVVQPFDASISPQSYITSSLIFATSILQSATYCIEPAHGVVGKSLLLLPLFVARNHFRQYGDEAQAGKCNDWLQKLGQKDMGFGVKLQRGSRKS